jgi:2,3-dihydroxybenzoate decarboxylase
MKKIAIEEHFLAPGFEEYWAPTMEDVPATGRDWIHSQLTDFGENRLHSMDAAGIQLSVLSLAGPGVQVERDTIRAQEKSKSANDFVAGEISKNPARYAGFAHLALQDPKWAAKELERCVRKLGFCGAMINGHSNGEYLDREKFFPLWECAEALEAPIYLHPADPVSSLPVLEGHKGLKRATWEWTVETGSHALRIIFAGVFDRFPRATLVLGHLGETLPYMLWRFDSRARLYGVQLKRRPSDYIRENVVVTTSGMFSCEPLLCALEALGSTRVLFSSDYPFESSAVAGDFIDTLSIDDDIKMDICFRNAEKKLKFREGVL